MWNCLPDLTKNVIYAKKNMAKYSWHFYKNSLKNIYSVYFCHCFHFCGQFRDVKNSRAGKIRPNNGRAAKNISILRNF
jgi:hypothetical protein